MGQVAQNRVILLGLLACACLYLSTARADITAHTGPRTCLEFRHLTNPQPGSGDPNDSGTTSNHPNHFNGTPGGASNAAGCSEVVAGSKVTGAPPEIPWLWLIVTAALSVAALGMGGHIILREEIDANRKPREAMA